MLRYVFIFGLTLLSTVLLSGCRSSTEPAVSGPLEITSEPVNEIISVSPDSLLPEKNPQYTIDYSNLKLKGVNLGSLKYYYPTPIYYVEVDKEFNIALKDSFSVVIKNCKSGYNWKVDLGSIDAGYYKWINSEVEFSRTEKNINPDSSINYKFIFNSLKKGKGYICFIEQNQKGEISSNESHGLIIGYTIEPLENIFVNVDNISWIYNSEKGAGSSVSVKITGTTNVYRLRAMTYGDGLISAMEIPVQNNNFEAEVPVAFSHEEGITLKTNTELIIYGTVGLPIVVQLKNPKNLDDVSYLKLNQKI